MKDILLFMAFISFMTIINAKNQRQIIHLNDRWEYKPATEVKKKAQFIPVTLPHTWNAHYIQGSTAYN